MLGMILFALGAIADESTLPQGVEAGGPGAREANVETGVASYYADQYHGKTTASGEPFDMHALTAAHPTLKFGTRVKVTHLASHRTVIVRINDRGPFVKGRVIDLSLAAAEELRMVRSGIARVKLEVLD